MARGDAMKNEMPKEKWVKVSGKHYYRDAAGGMSVIRPGDVVEFDLNNAPDPNDNQWRKLEGVTEEQKRKLDQGFRPAKAVHKGGGKWDIVTADGTKINKKPLTKVEAAAMVADEASKG
jgi:hypothetical protein